MEAVVLDKMEPVDQINRRSTAPPPLALSSLSAISSLYYRRLYPIQLILKWLSYGDETSVWLQNREFSFVLQNSCFYRNLFFRNEEQMNDEILIAEPLSINIGAVYSQRVESKSSLAFPIGRELVFDIDLSEYDEVRTCCRGSTVCSKCWRFMSLAIKILDVALRDDFGYRHILWVYSGRRGIHCWVCDQPARELNESARLAIVQYLSFVTPSNRLKKKVHFQGNSLPCCVRRAKSIIKEQFGSIMMDDQDILGSPEGMQTLLGMVGNEEVEAQLRAELQKHLTSADRWQATTQLLTLLWQVGKLERKHQHLVDEMMFQYAYPRLDCEVSLRMKHLLKSPYSIHPKTQNLCLPFDPNSGNKFDPCNVPTVQSVVNEMGQFVKGTVEEYNKTSMRESILVFEKFLHNMALEQGSPTRE